jgi:paraquat-inducible protein B
MSLKANYFKLGMFVIGGVVCLAAVLIVVGSGRAFQPKIAIETYFNESVQGLDIGSKVKYRGVVIGEVTKISFTYVKYQQDLPMSNRLRYVLVEAQLQPKLLGGRQAAEITGPESIIVEVERGLRVRSAPQGITGTNYLEIDYVDPPPPLLPILWTPDIAYIPSAPSTVTALVNSASEIMERLHRLDVEGTVANLNKLLQTATARVEAIDTKMLSQRTERVLAKVEATLDDVASKKLTDETVALIAELRETNREAKKLLASPGLQKLPEDAAAAAARLRAILDDPALAKTLQNLSRTLGRLDRITGGGEVDLAATIDNLRQITDNLRELSEDTKRYPANVFLGEPPRPLERAR